MALSKDFNSGVRLLSNSRYEDAILCLEITLQSHSTIYERQAVERRAEGEREKKKKGKEEEERKRKRRKEKKKKKGKQEKQEEETKEEGGGRGGGGGGGGGGAVQSDLRFRITSGDTAKLETRVLLDDT